MPAQCSAVYHFEMAPASHQKAMRGLHGPLRAFLVFTCGHEELIHHWDGTIRILGSTNSHLNKITLPQVTSVSVVSKCSLVLTAFLRSFGGTRGTRVCLKPTSFLTLWTHTWHQRPQGHSNIPHAWDRSVKGFIILKEYHKPLLAVKQGPIQTCRSCSTHCFFTEEFKTPWTLQHPAACCAGSAGAGTPSAEELLPWLADA